jgi:transposase
VFCATPLRPPLFNALSGTAAGRGHTGHGLKITNEIKETIELKPEVCTCCGGGLQEQEAKRVETRYQHEIPEIKNPRRKQRGIEDFSLKSLLMRGNISPAPPVLTAPRGGVSDPQVDNALFILKARVESACGAIKVETTKYNAYERRCPACGTVNRGVFPESVSGTQQYGPRLRAYMVMLLQYGMLRMKRLKIIMEALFGIRISEGTIAATVQDCAKRLEKPMEVIKEAVKRSVVVHFDETGMRNRGALWWLHTASTAFFTYLVIHKKRGNEAMDAIGILPDFQGVAVHDCLKSYWKYLCVHALCNAHLLRELVGILENTGQEWARKMIDLLLEPVPKPLKG